MRPESQSMEKKWGGVVMNESRKESTSKRVVGAWILLVLSGAALASGGGEGSDRFMPTAQLVGRPAEWVALDGNRVAYGSGSEAAHTRADSWLVLEGVVELDRPVLEAVLYADRLYLNEGDGIMQRPLAAPPSAATAVPLTPGPQNTLRLARMGDYLIVSETGVGLRVLGIPPPPEFQRMPGHDYPFEIYDAPTQVSLFPLTGEITALATEGRTILAAVAGRGIVELDAGDLEALSIERTLPFEGRVQALAAHGDRLYILGPAGLSVMEVGREGVVADLQVFPAITGSALGLAGRALYLAAGKEGLQVLDDRSPLAATHMVTVSNFSFTPSTLTVDVGDTVQWDNISGTHNTRSCDIGFPRTGCPAPSTETWNSGEPALAPWTFSHTFILVGSNPYTCTLHAGFGMQGTITVQAAASPPPAVPDGSGETNPMRGEKVDDAGSSLRITWDDTACSGALDNQILHGDETTLSGYGLLGSECGLGPNSPYQWDLSPSPTVGGMVWWLVVATDGSSTEGSWGTDSDGSERNGTLASGECGVTQKDTSNTCGL